MELIFQDNFSEGLNSFWTVSDYTTDNYAGGGSNVQFTPENISFPGCLCLKLTQPTANFSTGAEILSKEKFHFGTYEFSLRAGSTSTTPTGLGTTVSGQVSSSFILNASPPDYTSVTEIDAPEIEGLPEKSDRIEWDVWKNGVSSTPSPEYTRIIAPEADFHLYKFIWTKDKITFYIDNEYSSVCKSVPTAKAAIDLNFYGTNSSNWGGLATPGVIRYMYVNSVKIWSL
jgi:beta-glucanase (GH16 family)